MITMGLIVKLIFSHNQKTSTLKTLFSCSFCICSHNLHILSTMHMFFLFGIFLLHVEHFHYGTSDCAFDIDGHTIDLSSVTGSTIQHTDGQWTYYYTPCSDGLTCTDNDGVSQSCMSDQFKDGNDFCTAYLSLWTDVTPSYSDGTFTFTWSNGKSSNICADGRSFIAKWKCDNDATVPVATSLDVSTLI